MKTFYSVITVVFTVCLIGCSKKELQDEKIYYGKVKVEMANLPGTPEMEIRFDTLHLGKPGGAPFTIVAGLTGKLAVYKAGTDSLLADTMINLKKYEQMSFTIAYSEDFGIKGWINRRYVSPDSISLQMLNNLSEAFCPVPSPTLYIMDADESWQPRDTIAVLEHFERGKIHPRQLTLSVQLDPVTQMAPTYLGRLVDPATGQSIIVSPGSGIDYFIVSLGDFYKGTFGIYPVKDDAVVTEPVIL